MGKARVAVAERLSAASVVFVALRIQTPIMYLEFWAVGVQLKVLLGDQFWGMVQVAPSKSHHLNWLGATPPLALAVKVMVVLGNWGLSRSAVRELRVRGGGAWIVNTTVPDARRLSGKSAVLPALRPHSPMTYLPGVAGVQAKVVVVAQSWPTLQLVPSQTHHLVW
jgi:hypothetical protein